MFCLYKEVEFTIGHVLCNFQTIVNRALKGYEL